MASNLQRKMQCMWGLDRGGRALTWSWGVELAEGSPRASARRVALLGTQGMCFSELSACSWLAVGVPHCVLEGEVPRPLVLGCTV